jgi:hypothetical protein
MYNHDNFGLIAMRKLYYASCVGAAIGAILAIIIIYLMGG